MVGDGFREVKKPMSISDKLRQRIRALEMEQERQQQDLRELNQLRDLAAITELENELEELNKQGPRGEQKAAAQDIDFAEEALLEEEVKDFKPVENTRQEAKDIDLLAEFADENQKVKPTSGFVVCLMFNQSSPSEWSEEAGGGWRGKGMGTYYPSKALAQKKYNELKAKWPDYPIQIHHVKS